MTIDPIAPAPNLKGPVAADPTPAAVKKAAQEFEGMVLSQMLQPMFEQLDAGGMFGGGSAERMFRPMLVEQYAKGLTRAGGIGLSDAVAREMMSLQGQSQPRDAATNQTLKPPLGQSGADVHGASR